MNDQSTYAQTNAPTGQPSAPVPAPKSTAAAVWGTGQEVDVQGAQQYAQAAIFQAQQQAAQQLHDAQARVSARLSEIQAGMQASAGAMSAQLTNERTAIQKERDAVQQQWLNYADQLAALAAQVDAYEKRIGEAGQAAKNPFVGGAPPLDTSSAWGRRN